MAPAARRSWRAGLWRAADAAGMRAIVRSLPLDAWMKTEITPLSTHPGDPAIASS